ncbi:MAG TPA: IS701 family transposase [Alphaproteobacteria bacterium]|nr:IS701 family transposase [Alphaproteobacteria bacterium]
MDVHASPAALPELQEFLEAFRVRFRRPEGREALERYTTGLLTELPQKNCDTLAQAGPGTSAQRLQEFLTNMQWDEEDLNRQRVKKMIAEATWGDGVLVVDDTGMPKQGQASVGVARQYSGTLGKVGNCQVAVTCCDSARQATWPVAVRLYLPKTWAYDPERRQRARVPADVPVQTKPEIALALLDQARAWGVPHRCVVAEADDGDNPTFLAGLEARQESYVVGVRTDFLVSLRQAPSSRVWRADELLETVPRWQWRIIRWRRGTKGWLHKKFVAVRCWRVTSDGQRHGGWLLGERASRGQPEERKDFWSNLPAEAPLEELAGLAHRRHAIEQFHEEAKGELGWDQYQGRLWPGFHRHAVTVMLAYSFLVWLEQRQRRGTKGRGRRREPFSPSAKPPAQDAPGCAS